MARGGKQPGAGRPKGSIAKSTREALEYKEALIKAIRKDQAPIIKALLTKGKSGDVQALREIHDRAMGKASQPIEHSGSVTVEQTLYGGEYSKDKATT